MGLKLVFLVTIFLIAFTSSGNSQKRKLIKDSMVTKTSHCLKSLEKKEKGNEILRNNIEEDVGEMIKGHHESRTPPTKAENFELVKKKKGGEDRKKGRKYEKKKEMKIGKEKTKPKETKKTKENKKSRERSLLDVSCVSFFPELCKFVDELPIPPSIDMREGGYITMGAWRTTHKWHRDLENSSVYAYGLSLEEAIVPGPTILTMRNIPITILWENQILDEEPFFNMDTTLIFANPKNGGVPMVPHLHGGYVAPEFDGNPDAWFTAFGDYGEGYVTNNFTYLNCQTPTTLWYHDHSLGLTRSTVYAGLFGLYVIQDSEVEDRLNLPKGKNDVPLIIGDRALNADGSTVFPTGNVPELHPFWTPGTSGNYTTVNGKVWPYLSVQRQKYRFRIMVVSNARFYNLSFIATPPDSIFGNGPLMPQFIAPPNGVVVPFVVIGTDGGYLRGSVQVKSVLLSPAERFQILIDFSQNDNFSESYDVFLINNAPLPFPGNPENPPDIPVSTDTEIVMKFLVEPGRVDPGPEIPENLTYVPPAEPELAIRERFFKLTEYYNNKSNISPVLLMADMRRWTDPVTETPPVNTSEIWTFINASPGAHPIHIHLIQHRLLWRRPFDVISFIVGNCTFNDKWHIDNPLLPSCWSGPSKGPAAHEDGWKDTNINFPATTTSYLMKWALQDSSPFPFDATVVPGYVWHCHILDHEDNEMMRPIQLIQQYTTLPNGTSITT